MNDIGKRIASIDAMRGIVMLLMTVDHVRETFFLQHQVGDPMNVTATDPGLFFTRFAAHFCAPMFVFLTGLSAWLYAHPAGGRRSATGFLVKRGLLLVGLELTLVNFAWTGTLTPATVYLQVIWAIGLAMLALALLHRLPLLWVGLLGLLIVGGHNALHISDMAPGSPAAAAWTILEQRGFLLLEPVRIKISYPLLAWIGVILLGYACGPLYARTTAPVSRVGRLRLAGVACLAALLLLRNTNLYGEPVPWSAQAGLLHTVMSFLNFTKYPPSLDFVLLTLGCGALVLAYLDGRATRAIGTAAVFGSAPLFYYLLHLYALLGLQKVSAALSGKARVDVDQVWEVWAIAALLALALYWPTRRFGRYKRESGRAWAKYL